uniref:Reverse transcriptase domain-containing protein n=1 Tax=Tanacetum cinerariifolium TaxID=118510 RepID=A0A6L2LC46_TANCI|nr:reverse transcriptase domain-containing protein [Tanacetum cinerariifolium]
MKFVCSKENDEVMFIKIIWDNDEPQNRSLNEGEGATTEGQAVECFNIFPTKDELTYYKYLMSIPIPSIFQGTPSLQKDTPLTLRYHATLGIIQQLQVVVNELYKRFGEQRSASFMVARILIREEVYVLMSRLNLIMSDNVLFVIPEMEPRTWTTPRAIIRDHGTHFCNDKFAKVMSKYGVTYRLANAYHPQTSEHVEVSNRGLKHILERTIEENHASWSEKLDDAL